MLITKSIYFLSIASITVTLSLQAMLNECAPTNNLKQYVSTENLNKYLGEAAQTGNLKKAISCIQAGADPIAPTTPCGSTPLMKATYCGHLPVVKYLVELKVPINEIDPQLGISPFHAAIRQGHYHIVEYLAFNGADINLPNRTGKIPYIIAKEHAQKKIAHFLEQLPKKLMYATITDSAKIGNNAHVKLLLETNPSCINTQDYTERTALAWATKNANYSLVKMLLDYAADKNIADRNSVTPLVIALEMNDTTLIELLK